MYLSCFGNYFYDCPCGIWTISSERYVRPKTVISLVLKLMMSACVNSPIPAFAMQPAAYVKEVSWHFQNEGYESERYSPKIYEL